MTDFADISHHQVNPDFTGMKAAGATQVVMKATESSSYEDPEFAGWWARARTAGLNRTAYHFARPGTDPIACARKLQGLAHDAELPLVLDWEDPAVNEAWGAAFLAECDRLTGRKTVLYMPQSWCAKAGALVEWPLWAARYNWRLGSVKPWPAPTWWQFTDRGRLGPHVGDVSHMYSDLAAAPAAAPAPVPDEEDDMPLLPVKLKGKDPTRIFLTDWLRKREASATDLKMAFFPKPVPDPVELTQAQLDRIPDA